MDSLAFYVFTFTVFVLFPGYVLVKGAMNSDKIREQEERLKKLEERK